MGDIKTTWLRLCHALRKASICKLIRIYVAPDTAPAHRRAHAFRIFFVNKAFLDLKSLEWNPELHKLSRWSNELSKTPSIFTCEFESESVTLDGFNGKTDDNIDGQHKVLDMMMMLTTTRSMTMTTTTTMVSSGFRVNVFSSRVADSRFVRLVPCQTDMKTRLIHYTIRGRVWLKISSIIAILVSPDDPMEITDCNGSSNGPRKVAHGQLCYEKSGQRTTLLWLERMLMMSWIAPMQGENSY